MSATLLPTKTAGARPPIFPPVKTTFDGSPGDDSWLGWLQDDVRRVCRLSDASDAEGLDLMIGLLDVRRRMVVSEIWAVQATEDEPMRLPPFAGLPLDYLIERPTREQRMLQGLLDKLEECRARCERRLSRHRFEARLLRDLGASES